MRATMKNLPLFPVGSLVLGLCWLTAGAQEQVSSESAAIEPDVDPEIALVEESTEDLEGLDDEEVEFLTADLNQDGWLSGIEVGPWRAYDADRDGEITELEFMAGRARDRLSLEQGNVTQEDIDLFIEFDSTLSGYLSGTDIDRANAGTYDSDFDGRVTRDEFFRGRERDRAEAAARAAQAAEERRRENERRRAAGEAIDAPSWGEPLEPRKGFMIGWVTTADGEPLPEFTIEIVAFDVGTETLVLRKDREPQMIGRYKAKDGYYEVRLPDGSFGFVASVILDGPNGPTKYPLVEEGPIEDHLDYVEVNRSSEGVVKNLVWEYSLDDLP
jgi:hypothetical protein